MWIQKKHRGHINCTLENWPLFWGLKARKKIRTREKDFSWNTQNILKQKWITHKTLLVTCAPFFLSTVTIFKTYAIIFFYLTIINTSSVKTNNMACLLLQISSLYHNKHPFFWKKWWYIYKVIFRNMLILWYTFNTMMFLFVLNSLLCLAVFFFVAMNESYMSSLSWLSQPHFTTLINKETNYCLLVRETTRVKQLFFLFYCVFFFSRVSITNLSVIIFFQNLK